MLRFHGRHLSSHIIAKCIIFSDFKGCATKSDAKLQTFPEIHNFFGLFLPLIP